MLTEDGVLNFLSVKCDCTLDDLVEHINVAYSHFGNQKFSKEDVEKHLISICERGEPFYLEKNIDDPTRSIWKVRQSMVSTNKRFPYGGR